MWKVWDSSEFPVFYMTCVHCLEVTQEQSGQFWGHLDTSTPVAQVLLRRADSLGRIDQVHWWCCHQRITDHQGQGDCLLIVTFWICTLHGLQVELEHHDVQEGPHSFGIWVQPWPWRQPLVEERQGEEYYLYKLVPPEWAMKGALSIHKAEAPSELPAPPVVEFGRFSRFCFSDDLHEDDKWPIPIWPNHSASTRNIRTGFRQCRTFRSSLLSENFGT